MDTTTQAREQKNASMEQIPVTYLLKLCLSNWKWFVLSVLVAMTLAVLHILRTPPIYTRTTLLLVKEESKGASFSTKLRSFADMGMFEPETNVKNELTSIQSPDILIEVIKRLHLQTTVSKKGTFHDKLLYGTQLPVNANIIGLSDNASVSFIAQTSKDGKVVISEFSHVGEEIEGSFSGHINDTITTPVCKIVLAKTPSTDTIPVGNFIVRRAGLNSTLRSAKGRLSVALDNDENTILSISYRDVSPQRAEDFLRTLISVYNENWVKDKNQIAISSSQFINERLKVIEQELGNVDSDISSYKSEHLIPDVLTASNMYMQQASQASSQVLELNNQLYMARYIKNLISSESGQFELLPANSGINNASIERQIIEYNEKLLHRNQTLSNSSTDNPLIMDMDRALNQMKSAILSSVDNQINAIETHIRGFKASEQQNTAKLASNPTQAKYLLSVERQQKVKETLYLFLLQKREENEMSQAFTAYNTRVVASPYGDPTPTSPNTRAVLMMALLIGFCIPVVVIVVKENIDTKIREKKDLEKLPIPILGEIPQFTNKRKGLFTKKNHETMPIVVKVGHRDIINEAFRVLRTNLEFMCDEESQNNIIALTSFNPGSGKSFLSMNISVSLAIKGKKVIVIDGDLRRASTSAYVNSPKPGLSDYLSKNTNDINDIIVKDTNHENLSVIPVGTIPFNPTELLFSDRLKTLIETLKQEYDFVIIDCPPSELVADTRIIEKLADRTIFVVRAGLLDRSMLSELENYYYDKKFKNLCIVLNGTENKNSRYGTPYGKGYYGYYGNDTKFKGKWSLT